MDNENKEIKVVSAFEYAIREAANDHTGTTEHTDGVRPRTRAEEMKRREDSLRNQLSQLQIVRPDGTREDLIQD